MQKELKEVNNVALKCSRRELYSQIAKEMEKIRSEKLPTNEEVKNAHVFSEKFENNMQSLFAKNRNDDSEFSATSSENDQINRRSFTFRTIAAMSAVVVLFVVISTFGVTSVEPKIELAYCADPFNDNSSMVYCLIDGNTHTKQFTTNVQQIAPTGNRYTISDLQENFDAINEHYDVFGGYILYYDREIHDRLIDFQYGSCSHTIIHLNHIKNEDVEYITHNGKQMLFSYTYDNDHDYDFYSLTWVDGYEIFTIRTCELTKDELFDLYESVCKIR